MNPDPPDVEQVAPAEPEATEPAAAEPPPVATPTEPEEVVVWGRLAVDQARDVLVRRVASLGYSVRRRGEDGVVLRSGDWRGKVVVGLDGTLLFSHPVASLTNPPESAYTFDPAVGDATSLHTAETSGGGLTVAVLPSRRKTRAAEQRVFDATVDERASLRAILLRTQEEEHFEQIPARLDALWASGAPMTPGSAAIPEVDRRDAVFAYWASLPDDPFGARSTAVVERWMADRGEPPATDAERAKHEPRRADQRRLP